MMFVSSCLLIVGGIMTEIEFGEDGVLRWSAPVPPNGVILHYNVIITRANTGELVIRMEELEVLSIDLHNVCGVETKMFRYVIKNCVLVATGIHCVAR